MLVSPLAYSHIGDLLGNYDYDNAGDLPGARASYARMAALAKSFYEADPSDARAVADDGIASFRLGIVTPRGPKSGEFWNALMTFWTGRSAIILAASRSAITRSGTNMKPEICSLRQGILLRLRAITGWRWIRRRRSLPPRRTTPRRGGDCSLRLAAWRSFASLREFSDSVVLLFYGRLFELAPGGSMFKIDIFVRRPTN